MHLNMGHSSNNMLHNVYQHIRADAEKKFTDELNRLMSEALSGNSSNKTA